MRNVGYCLMATLIFVVGFWTGEYTTMNGSCTLSMYNPMAYYQAVQELTRSPYAALFPDAWYAAREAKHEMMIGGIVTGAAGLAYYIMGAPAAQSVLCANVHRSRAAGSALSVQQSLQQWREAQMDMHYRQQQQHIAEWAY